MFAPEFTMTSQSKEDLDALFKIIFGKSFATGYAIRDPRDGELWDPERYLIDPKMKHVLRWYKKPAPLRLVFFWAAPSGSHTGYVPFPFKMNAQGASDFAYMWLQEAEYGNEPDTDGHNEKGWTAYNERYSHVDGEYAAFVAVSPKWKTYGK